MRHPRLILTTLLAVAPFGATAHAAGVYVEHREGAGWLGGGAEPVTPGPRN